MNKPFLAPSIILVSCANCVRFLCLLCVATSPPPPSYSPFDQVCPNTTPISPCASEIISVKVPLTSQRNLVGLFQSSRCLTAAQPQSLLPIPLTWSLHSLPSLSTKPFKYTQSSYQAAVLSGWAVLSLSLNTIFMLTTPYSCPNLTLSSRPTHFSFLLTLLTSALNSAYQKPTLFLPYSPKKSRKTLILLQDHTVHVLKSEAWSYSPPTLSLATSNKSKDPSRLLINLLGACVYFSLFPLPLLSLNISSLARITAVAPNWPSPSKLFIISTKPKWSPMGLF